MRIIDVIGVLITVIAGGAIGVFLTIAYHERVKNQHADYEKELAENRDLYAALAIQQRQRLESGGPAEDEDDPVR
jgi:heme/copper-type cytochrome/quinol oxidase subunit 2